MRDNLKTKYDLAQVKKWLNDGEKQYCRKTHFALKKNTTITTSASTQEYSLPTDFLAEDAVFYDGTPLLKRHQAQTIEKTSETGDPTRYYIRQKVIGLYAIPTAEKTITLIYWGAGGAMVDASDVPVIPDEHQVLIAYYACIQMSLEGDDDRVTKFKSLWDEGIEEAIRDVTGKYYDNQWPVALEARVEMDPIDHDLSILEGY